MGLKLELLKGTTGMGMSSYSFAERRYDRIAWIFNAMEFPMERMAAQRWREKLFSGLEGMKRGARGCNQNPSSQNT